MENIELEVSLENNGSFMSLFIANENGTGANYTVPTVEEVGKCVADYIKDYCIEN